MTLREEAVTQARQTIERRVNELGVAEPSIAQQGANGDEILVQLPGVSDIDRAKQIIQSTGLLQLKIVEQGPVSSREALLVNGQVPSGMEIVPGASGAPGDASTVYYLVKRVAAVEGRDLRSARPGIDSNGRPAVNFTLNSEGARKFGDVTGANIGRNLAIILDNRVQTAPVINGRITADGIIEGIGSQEEVQNLSLILRSGSLPATLSYLQERTIGPTLGADSIRAGFVASLVGLLLVVVVHARLLQDVRRERGRRAALQPGHPARPDGLHGRGDDAARHRRLHPDDGHGRRLERAHLRAHQRGAGRRTRRARVDQRRVQPRLPDAARHAHLGAHRRGVPLPVRHRADSRVSRSRCRLV